MARPAALPLLLLLAAATLCAAGRERRRLGAENTTEAVDPGREKVHAHIVNGKDSTPGRYPYIASLWSDSDFTEYTCEGTLIHPQVVLTAAHCVHDMWTCTDNAEKPYVRVGGYNLYGDVADKNAKYVERQARRVVVHPQFNCGAGDATGDPPTKQNFLNNDVALLKLDWPIKSIEPVKLIGHKPKADWRNPVRTGSLATVLGWGTTAWSDLAETLQELTIQVLSLKKVCAQQWPATGWEQVLSVNTWHNNSMMCAYKNFPNSDSGTCLGDSGGPLVVTGQSAASDRQIGITSWTGACGAPTAPSVFTDVGEVFPWIAAGVQQLTGDELQA